MRLLEGLKNLAEDIRDLLEDALTYLAVERQYGISWRLLRGVGELQILTRASYFLLVVVPILASTWPGVRLIVNQQNKAILDASIELQQVRQQAESALTELRVAQRNVDGVVGARIAEGVLAKLEQSARLVSMTSQRYAIDLAGHTLQTPILPWTLAAAFFAALSVTLAHLVYQVAAPEPIRKNTWEEFVLARKEDYARHSSDIAIDRAQDFLRSQAGFRLLQGEKRKNFIALRRLEDANGSERVTMLSQLSTSRLRSLLGLDDEEFGVSYPLSTEIKDELQRSYAARQKNTSEMSLVEMGSRAEYLALAGVRPLAALLTVFLYAFGLWMILLIIKVQAESVIAAAGFKSIYDLILH